MEISMEICLILLQIVLNLDQRVEHLLINSVNQYSLGTVFLPNQWKHETGRGGEGSGLKDFLPLRGGGGVLIGRLPKKDLLQITIYHVVFSIQLNKTS